jgi:hypothetical protein
MNSQDPMKGVSYREEQGTDQSGVERKTRKRRWGERVPPPAAEDRGGTERKAGNYASDLAEFSPTKERKPCDA